MKKTSTPKNTTLAYFGFLCRGDKWTPEKTAATEELQRAHLANIMRLAEMPKVETVIVPTYDFWGGVGEPTSCVTAPAVLNAIAAATG